MCPLPAGDFPVPRSRPRYGLRLALFALLFLALAGALLLRVHNRLAGEAARRKETAGGFGSVFVGYIARADTCFMTGDLAGAGNAIALAEETASSPVEAALAMSFRGRLEEWSGLRPGADAVAGRRRSQAVWREAIVLDPNCASARAQLVLSLSNDLRDGMETVLGTRNPTPEASEPTALAWRALDPIARELEQEIARLEATFERGASPLPAPVAYHQANLRNWTYQAKERLNEWRRGIPERSDR